jgi:hypothetical protein
VEIQARRLPGAKSIFAVVMDRWSIVQKTEGSKNTNAGGPIKWTLRAISQKGRGAPSKGRLVRLLSRTCRLLIEIAARLRKVNDGRQRAHLRFLGPHAELTINLRSMPSRPDCTQGRQPGSLPTSKLSTIAVGRVPEKTQSSPLISSRISTIRNAVNPGTKCELRPVRACRCLAH